MTVEEIARKLDLSVATVRARVRALRLRPTGVRKTGRRGRPAATYSAEDARRVAGVKK